VQIRRELGLRADFLRIDLPDDLAAKLGTYYELLVRWNRTINLTSLTDSADAIDRLLLEPVAAASHLPSGASLVDVGSGGGSPAIPLALTLSSPSLVMIESKSRKAAFLREAIRELGMSGSRVEERRFEEAHVDPASVVSVRAVQLDDTALKVLKEFVERDGVLAHFVSVDTPPESLRPGWRLRATYSLIPQRNSRLRLCERID
jgi:16S rRNA (guanine527-N7)-methyltransferase